jgi:hypothetical protein
MASLARAWAAANRSPAAASSTFSAVLALDRRASSARIASAAIFDRGQPRRFGRFGLRDDRARALGDGFLSRLRFDGAQQRQIGRRREKFVERRERDVLVFGVLRDFDQFVAVVEAADGRDRGRFVFRVTRDATERARIGRARKRLGADRIRRDAAGDRRQAARVGQGRDSRHGRLVTVAGRGHGHQAVGRAVAGFGIGVAIGHPAEHHGVGRAGDGRPAHPGVGVGFGQDSQLCRVLQLTDRLQSNGGVGVLPAGRRLELVQESHVRNGCVRKIRAGTVTGRYRFWI